MTVCATAKKKKRALRARIGDLAIAKFDDSTVVCIVTGRSSYGEYNFLYWYKEGNRTDLCQGTLPRCRLVRARPNGDFVWAGELSELTLDLVDPIYEGE